MKIAFLVSFWGFVNKKKKKQHKCVFRISSPNLLRIFWFRPFPDEFCEEYPHNLIPTPGYWIECSRQKINMPNQMTIWDDSEEENDDDRGGGDGGPSSGCVGNTSESHLDRGCSDLYEDDEDSEAVPR